MSMRMANGVGWKLVHPFLILLLVVLGCNIKPQEQTPKVAKGPFADLPAVQKEIRSRIKIKKKWDGIEFTKLENNKITIHLNYRGSPSSMSEVQADTDSIADEVLKYMREKGYDSKKEWLELFVHAQRHEQGASGSPVVRRYGKTMYDFSNDSLKFSKAGSFY